MFFSKSLVYGALALSFFASSTIEASFSPSPYSEKYDNFVTAELAKMNFDIPGVGNLKQLLTQYAVISYSTDGYGDANFLYHTLSFLDLFGATPASCSEQSSFGKDGKWTETICAAYDMAVDICTNDESSCDAASFPKITAGKMSNMKNNELASTMLICLFMTGMDATQCQPPFDPTSVYSQRFQSLFYLMENVVPDGLDNVLLSNARGMLGATTGIFAVDPNSHYTIGDGKLSIYESIMRRKLLSVLIKFISGPSILVNSKIRDSSTSLDLLHSDVLSGYYSQKYAEKFYSVNDRKRYVNLSKFMFPTKCGAAIGIIVAARCGFDADDVYGFLEYYDSLLTGEYENDTERYCSAVKFLTYKRATKYMKSHEFDISEKVATNEECMEKMKFNLE